MPNLKEGGGGGGGGGSGIRNKFNGFNFPEFMKLIETELLNEEEFIKLFNNVQNAL